MRIRVDREKNTINEINGIEQFSLGNFSFLKQPIRVKTRKIHSSVTLEAQQDIKAIKGIDMMQSMIDSLASEMTDEIDKEVIRTILDRIEITHFDRIIHYIAGEDLCLTAKNYHLKTS
jgi:hypothetical protein